MIQSDISKWHRQTFGDGADIFDRIVKKSREEFGEWMEDLRNPNEIADVAICLFAAADRLDFDLLDAVRSKFEVVKSRSDQIQRDAERGIT